MKVPSNALREDSEDLPRKVAGKVLRKVLPRRNFLVFAQPT